MRISLMFPESVDNAVVDAELVFAGPDAAHGLMGRAVLGVDSGMLFDLGRDSDHQFWMRGMRIPLDMIFLDGADRVVGIVENAQPGDETRRGVGGLSRRVLEVNAGWAAEHGVAAGQRVTGGAL